MQQTSRVHAVNRWIRQCDSFVLNSLMASHLRIRSKVFTMTQQSEMLWLEPSLILSQACSLSSSHNDLPAVSPALEPLNLFCQLFTGNHLVGDTLWPLELKFQHSAQTFHSSFAVICIFSPQHLPLFYYVFYLVQRIQTFNHRQVLFREQNKKKILLDSFYQDSITLQQQRKKCQKMLEEILRF